MRAALQLVAALRRGVRALGSGATRDPRFAHLDQADVTALRALCPATDDAEALEQHNVDWMRKYRGRAALALRPRSAREAAAALEYCSKRRLAVVPQGGNTGLVGGSVPLFDEIVLSTRAMDKVESVDPDTGVAVAGAGCILQHLDEAMSAKGWMAPLDLGAKGTCVIGGNVSTNAGGLRLLRYGSLRGSVLGLEVALADGSVLDLMSENRKDATGYDLKQLFIGAEGTLGVVTSVAIQGAPRPSAVNVAWLAVPGYGEVLAALRLARRRLGEVLSAFELVDAASLRLALGNLPHNRDPLPECTSPFYVLVETSGSNDAHDAEKLESFLEEALGEGVVRDGVVAASERESAALWELREGISDALTARGGVHKYDVSVPLKELYKMVDECRDVVLAAGLGDVAEVCGYGHCGDGNLHLNVSAPGVEAERVKAALEPWVYEWVAQRKGSISAEHGLGQMKAEAIGYTKSPQAVAIMASLKHHFDPAGILNPYKVLPQEALAAARRRVA